jgi:hypothetical protein
LDAEGRPLVIEVSRFGSVLTADIALEDLNRFESLRLLEVSRSVIFFQWRAFFQRAVTYVLTDSPSQFPIIMAETWDPVKFDKDMQALMVAKLPISESKIKGLKNNAMQYPKVSICFDWPRRLC